MRGLIVLALVAAASSQVNKGNSSAADADTTPTAEPTAASTPAPVATPTPPPTAEPTKLTRTVTSTSATSTSSLDDEHLPDCECEEEWLHQEFKCNSSSPGFIKHGDFLGCPTLEALSACEVEPQQSWCPTTRNRCKQQDGAAVGNGWAFCSPKTQDAELPGCTCAQIWLNGQGENCMNSRNRKRISGCPTVDELKQCDPSYDGKAWCLTNEARCLEQVDCPDCDEESEHEMEGDQWAYCQPDSQVTEMPDCECEDEWTPNAEDCPGLAVLPTFNQCPSANEMAKCPGMFEGRGSGQKTWCHTKQDRCKQQSESDVFPSMVNEGWAFCNPKSEEPVFPECDCMEKWENEDGECKHDPLPMEGCPTQGQLHVCDHVSMKSAQTWCETTYKTCSSQNYEAQGQAWVYCDHTTQAAELADCECMDTWAYNEAGSACAESGVKMRGCPTAEEMAVCEPKAKNSWCLTKDMTCKQQDATDGTLGEGWVYCDPMTQGAIHVTGSTGLAIGITFFATVLACTAIFLGLLYGYRRYTKQKRAEYTKQLLGGGGYD